MTPFATPPGAGFADVVMDAGRVVVAELVVELGVVAAGAEVVEVRVGSGSRGVSFVVRSGSEEGAFEGRRRSAVVSGWSTTAGSDVWAMTPRLSGG
ncbi:MAG: hypothetical protein WBQ44_21985 [Rhodococcus sp. (in: high G+C Gram-positive bacteria)]